MTDPKGDRYVSLDVWRGFALLTIFINHVPGNALEPWTHKNFGFSDAAELFVLLAGASAALAYLPGMAPGSQARQVTRIALRAWALYMAHLVVIALCGAAIAYGVIVTGDVRILEATQFDQIIGAPARGGRGRGDPGPAAGISQHPAALYRAPAHHAGLSAAGAHQRGRPAGRRGALYVVAQLGRLTLPSYPGVDAWYFNPLTWQFLYAVGLAGGTLLARGVTVRVPTALWWAAVAYVVGALVWSQGGFYNPHDLYPLPRFVWDFDKTNLSLPRLLHVLALAVIVVALPLEQALRNAAAVKPLVMLGRQSLPVFCVGSVIAIAAMPLRASEMGHAALDFLVIGGGIAVQFSLAWVLEWYRSGAKAMRSDRAAKGAPVAA